MATRPGGDGKLGVDAEPTLAGGEMAHKAHVHIVEVGAVEPGTAISTNKAAVAAVGVQQQQQLKATKAPAKGGVRKMPRVRGQGQYHACSRVLQGRADGRLRGGPCSRVRRGGKARRLYGCLDGRLKGHLRGVI